MPTDPNILGFTNRWYQEGIQQKVKVSLDAATTICIFSAPYFLASKMEAFLGRGNGDLFGSHNLEDIIYILDHRLTIKEELLSSPENVRSYLVEQFGALRNQPHSMPFSWNLSNEGEMERVRLKFSFWSEILTHSNHKLEFCSPSI